MLPTVAGVTFDAAGALTSPAAPGLLAAFNPNTVAPAGRYPSWNNNVQIDISGLTQFGGANTLGAPHKLDVAVPRPELADFVEQAQEIVAQARPEASLWVFGHAGEGSVHLNLTGVGRDDSGIDDLLL